MRAARVNRSIVDAADQYARCPSILALGGDLARRGYALTPKARVFPRLDGHFTVRLVWRHRALNSSIVLTLTTPL